jgi:hypothetical protein
MPAPPGYIRRKSYIRKAYTKTSPSGKKNRISATKVSASYVPAKGKALIRGRKTPAKYKILPSPKGLLHLRAYGYGTHKPAKERRAALLKAMRENNDLSTKGGRSSRELEVLRHLNLIRNFQADPKAKAIMAADVKFMSEVRKKKKSPKKKSTRKRIYHDCGV